jgi:hypothetical protein
LTGLLLLVADLEVLVLERQVQMVVALVALVVAVLKQQQVLPEQRVQEFRDKVMRAA